MPKPDMSPEAVTTRLKRTSQLRRLCLALNRNQPANDEQRPPANDRPQPGKAPVAPRKRPIA